MPQTDVKVLVPRVQRAVARIGGTLTSEEAESASADALSSILLYTGSVFGKQLVVTSRTAEGIPSGYATTDELTLAEETVVAAQAALDYFVSFMTTGKTSEQIADEAQSWSWSRSAQALRDAFAYLIGERDRAIEATTARAPGMVAFESFLAVRDVEVARLIEPFAAGMLGAGGLEADPRFA